MPYENCPVIHCLKLQLFVRATFHALRISLYFVFLNIRGCSNQIFALLEGEREREKEREKK